jgi:hypothetical protein
MGLPDAAMTPDEFTADLSARLHSQGVNFDAAALEAFASHVRREQAQGDDAQTLLDRFLEAREDYAQAMRRAFYAGHAVSFGIVLILVGMLGLGVAAFVGLTMLLASTPSSALAVVVVGLVFLAGCGVAAAGVVRAVTAAVTLAGARREAEEAFQHQRPTIS